MRIYTEVEMATEMKSMRFTKQTYVAAFGIETIIFSMNPLIVIQDQVRQFENSDLTFSTRDICLFVTQ